VNNKHSNKAFDPKDKLTFLKQPRETDKKRDSSERQIDFKEIYHDEEKADLQSQAGRCLDCGNPYCEWKCPLHNYIPNWLELAANEKFEEAAVLMHQTNPLPEICGRVCPQDRLCEQACTINTGFGAVTIGAIEKNISDLALANNWRPDLSAVEQTDKTVAIVGAGPAGIGCAELLVRHGVKAVVYDRYPEIGGLLTFGIPGFKLEKDVIKKRREFLEDIGVEFKLNTEIGKDITIEELQDSYHQIFLGMGTYTALDGNLEGLETEGVIKALDYLIGNINFQQNYEMDNVNYSDMKDEKVIVLGGGDTAMDCVRSAIRQSATTVKCVYRKGETSMPGSKQEVQNAKEEGVDFVYHLQPVAIENINGKVTGVRFHKTNSDGNSDEEVFIEADKVIIAFGFTASPASWFDSINLELTDKGLLKTLNSNQSDLPYLQATSVKGIYAGGDMVRGADLVVTAIAEGRQAALEILAEFDILTS
jgi:glutamate synthase (NADPH/NADH) small chain